MDLHEQHGNAHYTFDNSVCRAHLLKNSGLASGDDKVFMLINAKNKCILTAIYIKQKEIV